MNKFIEIAKRKIGADYPPYIIAELSANHNGNIDNAFRLIEIAKECGADAVKIQTYRPDTITIDCDKEDFQIEKGLWKGKSLYQLYEWAHTPWEWHHQIFKKAKEVGITIFSSPFDFTAVDLLEELDAPAYKIASFELVDLPLIRYVASKGKPMILSTGLANDKEIKEAIDAAYSAGCTELIVLHCVSGYPAPAEDYNLATIPDMISRFGVITGLSDHTIDNTTAIASVVLGSSVIEKHITLDRRGGGPDDSFSLEPDELKALCRDTKIAWRALGSVNYEPKESEKANVKFRRSLYVIKDISKGDTFSSDNVKSIRPGYGLAPKYFDQISGRKASCDITAGTRLTFDIIE